MFTHSCIMSTGRTGDAAPVFSQFDQWDVLFYKNKPHYALGVKYGVIIRTLMTEKEFNKVNLEFGIYRNGMAEMKFLLPVEGDTVVSRLRTKLNHQANANKRKRVTLAKSQDKTAAKKPRLSKTAKK